MVAKGLFFAVLRVIKEVEAKTSKELFFAALRVIKEVEDTFLAPLRLNRSKWQYWIQRRIIVNPRYADTDIVRRVCLPGGVLPPGGVLNNADQISRLRLHTNYYGPNYGPGL